MTDPQLPPEGWYDDPYGAPVVRWWDGSTWTDQTAPPPTAGTGPTGGAGPNGLLDIGAWLTETFQCFRGRLGDLFAIIALVQIVSSAMVGLGLWFGLREFELLISTVGDNGDVDVSGGSTAALGAVIAVAGGLFGLSSRAAVTHQLAAAQTEPPLPWSVSIAHGLRRLPKIIGVAILTGLVLIVMWLVAAALAFVSPLLLLLTIPAALVGSIWWWIRSSLFGTAVALVPPGVSAVKTSFALTRTRVFALFGRLLLLGLIGFAASLATNVVSAPINALAGFDTQLTSPAGTPSWLIETDNSILIDGGAFAGSAPFALLVTLLVAGILGGFVSAIRDSAHLSIFRQLDGPIDPAIEQSSTMA